MLNAWPNTRINLNLRLNPVAQGPPAPRESEINLHPPKVSVVSALGGVLSRSVVQRERTEEGSVKSRPPFWPVGPSVFLDGDGLAEARFPQLLRRERGLGFLCPGRQTDPTRQKAIRPLSFRQQLGRLGDGLIGDGRMRTPCQRSQAISPIKLSSPQTPLQSNRAVFFSVPRVTGPRHQQRLYS
jgi:hypothetical protein